MVGNDILKDSGFYVQKDPKVVNSAEIYLRGKHTHHAEFVAIRKVKNKQDLYGAKIYIVKNNQAGSFKHAPCQACQRMIDKFKMEVV